MNQPQEKRSSRRFRYRTWFGFLLVCAVAFSFPPWLVHYKPTYPAPFSSDWFFAFDFHFWTYRPVGYIHVSPSHGAHYIKTYSLFKHLNYCILGVEVILLGLLGLYLKAVIRLYEDSLRDGPCPPVMAKILQKMRESEQAGAGQPATRPVVEPKGSYKPQPEAEGRSR